MTPTAYTYGSVQSNARLALSEGLLQYLEQDESNAVIGHDLVILNTMILFNLCHGDAIQLDIFFI